MEYVISILLVLGFGAVVYTNLRIHKAVTDFDDHLKARLDDIVNDINDINNHLMDSKSKNPDK